MNENTPWKEEVQLLFDNAVTWNKCVLARQYISAARNNSDSAQVDSCVAWANQQVDRIESTIFSQNHLA